MVADFSFSNLKTPIDEIIADNGRHSIMIGMFCGSQTRNGHHNIFIGDFTGIEVYEGNYNIIIGNNITGVSGSRQFIISDFTGWNEPYISQSFYNMFPRLIATIEDEYLPILSENKGEQLVQKMHKIRDICELDLSNRSRAGTFDLRFPPPGIPSQIG